MNKESCRYICKESFCLLNFILICYGHPDCPGALNCSFGNATVALVLPSVRALSAVQIFIIVIKVLFAVGIITCVLSHYKMGARSWSDQRNRQQPTTRQLQQPCPQQQQYTYSLTPTTASMISVAERQRLAHHDHLVRLHSVQTDLALNLPHSIALPEEGPPTLLKLHDPQEITRSFIRPPPNRTVANRTYSPPPPYVVNQWDTVSRQQNSGI